MIQFIAGSCSVKLIMVEWNEFEKLLQDTN